MTDRTDAQDRIDALLRELAELVGPTIDDDIDVDGECLLAEWVVVSAWVDESGASWVCSQTSENLTWHHKVGLLHVALD